MKRDIDDVSLLGLGEEQLVSPADVSHVSRACRVRLADVLSTGILNVGDVLVWKRSGKNEKFRACCRSQRQFHLCIGLTDKGKADKSSLNAGKIRTCEKCHRELPSTYRYSKCDNCHNRFAKMLDSIVLAAVPTIAGLAVKCGSKADKAVAKFIAKGK